MPALAPPPFPQAPIADATGQPTEPWKRWFLKVQTQTVLSGTLTVTGGNLTFTLTGATTLTLPTSGTLLNSAQIAARISLGM